MKVLYVHGFGGSANGASSKIVLKALKEAFPDEHIEFNAPAIPYMDPVKAHDFIELNSRYVDLVIASSLGAFYASTVDSNRALLINPASPEDVKRVGNIPNDMFLELKKLELYRNSHLDNDTIDNVYLMFGKNDEVLNNKEYYSNLYTDFNVYDFNGKHKLSDSDVEELITVLKDIV